MLSVCCISINDKEPDRVVSSAYEMKLNILQALEMSFRYIKKRSGPSTEPCGTPALIVFRSEVELS